MVPSDGHSSNGEVGERAISLEHPFVPSAVHLSVFVEAGDSTSVVQPYIPSSSGSQILIGLEMTLVDQLFG